MDFRLIDWLKVTRPLLPKKLGRILEVGSLNINGSSREVYTDCENYVGIDMRSGKDVDIVINGHEIASMFGESSFDIVICMDTLEHDDKFWETMENINMIIKPGGFLVFSIPDFNFPYHPHPEDYWRMSEQAVRKVIFDGYEILNLENISMPQKEGRSETGIICAIGKKL